MSPTSYREFFATAFGGGPDVVPYAYQCRLAGGDKADPEGNFAHGTECQSRLIDIPTGLGKTAGVVLAWLWNRVIVPSLDSWQPVLSSPEAEGVSTLSSQPRVRHSLPSEGGSSLSCTWPRRLVYCLPMRTLVEQTEREAGDWIQRLAERFPENEELTWLAERSPVILVGGEELDEARREWDIYPEKPAILIGTQDMLLSRALNRGYGMSRYRWPVHFASLNNDALWVMDETQLMGPGMSTACQLEAFRNAPALQGYDTCGAAGSVTWYMSATSSAAQLETREWREVARPAEFEFSLSPAEKAATAGPIHQRRFATKLLECEPTCSFSDPKASKALLDGLLERHERMAGATAENARLSARTLILCNTVDRARSVHALLAGERPAGCDLVLLHSRFRSPEREAQRKRVEAIDRSAFPRGQIVVSTQVIEAGVDLSSAILCSEVAPLASLVQRLGRLNRAGEFNESKWKPVAIIVGVGVENAAPRETKEASEKREKENAGRCLPYDLPACKSAWVSLQKLDGDASPASLEGIRDDITASIPRCPYSLQRHELADFFDTDANLSLGFTDVSPFVRGLDDDTDLQVCWREPWLLEDGSEGSGKPGFTPDFQRDELCPVPISKAKDARAILNLGWLWRGKESDWQSVRDAGLAPGMTVLLPLAAGGYDVDAGWTGNPTENKHPSHYVPKQLPSDEDLLSCLVSGWQSIAVHTDAVAKELRDLLSTLLGNRNEAEPEALLRAVPWHDVGKNHPDWQHAVRVALEKAGISGKNEHRPFAKFSLSESPSLCDLTGEELKREVARLRRTFRPRIVHEVASALAFRQAEQKRLDGSRDTNLASLLAEYVIMSHHGRVRKVLRDEIPKFPESEKDNETVRGVADGVLLPAVTIDGQSLAGEPLSTDCRRMGRDANGHESYTRSVLRLLEYYGPFRLAWYEAIFRAADCRASAKASRNVAPSLDSPDFENSVVREDSAPYGEGATLSAEKKALVDELVPDGLEIQGKSRPEPLYKRTGKGHYEGSTVEDIQEARKEPPPSQQ